MVSVYGQFKQTLILELALNKLREAGFAGENVLVVVLEPCPPVKQAVLDSMHSSDGKSLLDGIAIFATVGMVLGVIYGSISYVGSVAMGLGGMAVGGGLGYLIDVKINRGKIKNTESGSASGDVMVTVRCRDEDDAARVEKIMRQHNVVALGSIATAQQ